VNVPFGLVTMVVVALVLKLPKPTGRRRFDVLGTLLLTAASTCLVLLTSWGGTEYAWTSTRIMELIALGVASLVGFVFWQTRAAEPVVPLHIFRSLNFTLMSVIGFIVGFVMFGATLFLPLYQQSVQGASATNSGLLLLPMLGAMLVTSMVAGRVTTNTGRYKVFPVVGSALLVLGLYLLSTMDTGTSRLTSGVFMAVVGLGMGCLMQITMLVAQNSVELKDMGV
ncbi:MFS transporter, partial [Streptomyces sp. DH12]|uniref:MFS transporter n=1 Tax=Streptomyces sp. DH12 TaxID=2857010 RepID=UPI0034D44485